MSEPSDYSEILKAAFSMSQRRAGEAVPGARLRQAVDREFRERGLDFRAILTERGETFASFLESTGTLAVLRRHGTDVLVAANSNEFDEAVTRGGPNRPLLQPDIYEAMTRILPQQTYFYDTATGRVTRHEGTTTIPMPATSWGEQIAWRRQFADAKGQPELVGHEADPRATLGNFRAAVETNGFQGDWHEFKREALTRKLLEWATEQAVEVSGEWFVNAAAPPRRTLDLATVLRRSVDLMTEAELMEIRLPLRVVAQLLGRG